MVCFMQPSTCSRACPGARSALSEGGRPAANRPCTTPPNLPSAPTRHSLLCNHAPCAGTDALPKLFVGTLLGTLLLAPAASALLAPQPAAHASSAGSGNSGSNSSNSSGSSAAGAGPGLNPGSGHSSPQHHISASGAAASLIALEAGSRGPGGVGYEECGVGTAPAVRASTSGTSAHQQQQHPKDREGGLARLYVLLGLALIGEISRERSQRRETARLALGLSHYRAHHPDMLDPPMRTQASTCCTLHPLRMQRRMWRTRCTWPMRGCPTSPWQQQQMLQLLLAARGAMAAGRAAAGFLLSAALGQGEEQGRERSHLQGPLPCRPRWP